MDSDLTMPLPDNLTDACADELFDNFDEVTLLTWGQLSRIEHVRVKSYFCRRFNYHQLLRRWFNSEFAWQFRILQKRGGIVVSGSQALSLFTRQKFGPDSDLDVYVPLDYATMTQDFLRRAGFVRLVKLPSHVHHDDDPHHADRQGSSDSSEEDEEYPELPFTEVISYRHFATGSRLQTIMCKTHVLNAVLQFHSTCVMNIITHNKAYCLFPKATLLHRWTLPSNFEIRRHTKALQKYSDRGWHVLDEICFADHYEEIMPDFECGVRRIGDKQCWTMNLFPPFLHDTVNEMENNTWMIFENQRGPGIVQTWDVLRCGGLNFSYLVAQQNWLWLLVEAFKRNREPGTTLTHQCARDTDLGSYIDWLQITDLSL